MLKFLSYLFTRGSSQVATLAPPVASEITIAASAIKEFADKHAFHSSTLKALEDQVNTLSEQARQHRDIRDALEDIIGRLDAGETAHTSLAEDIKADIAAAKQAAGRVEQSVIKEWETMRDEIASGWDSIHGFPIVGDIGPELTNLPTPTPPVTVGPFLTMTGDGSVLTGNDEKVAFPLIPHVESADYPQPVQQPYIPGMKFSKSATDEPLQPAETLGPQFAAQLDPMNLPNPAPSPLPPETFEEMALRRELEYVPTQSPIA